MLHPVAKRLEALDLLIGRHVIYAPLVVQIIGIARSFSKLAMTTLKEKSGLGNSLAK